MSDKTLDKLRKLLEGKTIAKIEPPNASEAICRFVLTDGTAFRLHATDLGYWMEETEGPNGYQSLHGLLTDYGHHSNSLLSQYNFDPPDAVIVREDKEVKFSAADGKIFSISWDKLLPLEQKIINNPVGIKLLAEAAAMGDAWKIIFQFQKMSARTVYG